MCAFTKDTGENVNKSVTRASAARYIIYETDSKIELINNYDLMSGSDSFLTSKNNSLDKVFLLFLRYFRRFL